MVLQHKSGHFLHHRTRFQKRNNGLLTVLESSRKCLLTGMCQSPFPRFFSSLWLSKNVRKLHLHTKTLVTNKMTAFFGSTGAFIFDLPPLLCCVCSTVFPVLILKELGYCKNGLETKCFLLSLPFLERKKGKKK